MKRRLIGAGRTTYQRRAEHNYSNGTVDSILINHDIRNSILLLWPTMEFLEVGSDLALDKL